MLRVFPFVCPFVNASSFNSLFEFTHWQAARAPRPAAFAFEPGVRLVRGDAGSIPSPWGSLRFEEMGPIFAAMGAMDARRAASSRSQTFWPNPYYSAVYRHSRSSNRVGFWISRWLAWDRPARPRPKWARRAGETRGP